MADEPTPDAPDDAPEAPDGDTPDEPFDRDRAMAKIGKANQEARSLRERLKELEPLAAKAKELEESQKTEQQKLAEQLEAAKAEGATSTSQLLRLDVALDKAPAGTDPAEIRKLAKRLTGSSREELESDAEELFAMFAGRKGGSGQRPTEDLRRVPLDTGGKAELTDMNEWMRAKRSGS